MNTVKRTVSNNQRTQPAAEPAAGTANISCTVIIPTRDQLDFLKTCVESVLGSSYSGDLEVLIVDNGSQEAATLDFLQDIQSDIRISVIHWNKPFNFSELNNIAARQAKGEVLCFLNNDIEVRSGDWLEKLVPLAQHPDMGAIGTLLLYPNETVQHGGVVLNKEQVAIHMGVGASWEQTRATYQLDRVYPTDAVTAACMLTRKDLFLTLGGFDEEHLPVSFNDVDYCLKLQQAGYPIGLYPGVQLVHHESVTRKCDTLPENRQRALRESGVMKVRWASQLDAAGFNCDLTWLALDQTSANAAPLHTEALVRNFRIDRQNWEKNKAASSLATNWEEKFHLLEQEYRALEKHARAVESQLDLLLHSRLWRLTQPLRSLAQHVRVFLRRNSPVTLVSHSQSDAAVNKPDAGNADYKLAHSQQATAALAQFLLSDEELIFDASQPAKVSIILVLYNQAALTLLCLRSLLEHSDVSMHLIIVDNASSDQTSALLDRLRNVTILRNSGNVGFVDAVNQGAEKAEGEYILLLNNDAVLHPHALSSALDVFATTDNVGAVGGKIVLLDGTLQEAGSIIWNDGSCLGYGRGRNPEDPEFMFTRDVDYCSGAFLLTPRALFESMHGFDTDFAPAYYEESDYCVRLQKSGYRIVYEPRACITHYEFASSGGFAGASKLQQEHRTILCAKHDDFLEDQFANAAENILCARTANRKQNLLFIDDRVPQPDLGAGYPRCQEILRELSEMEFNISFYPLIITFDVWSSIYRTLPHEIEVLLSHGKSALEKFLQERGNYYDIIIISRNPNMELFRRIIDRHPEYIKNSRVIYDAEAVLAPREAAYLRLQGQQISANDEKNMIAEELELARSAHTIITVSAAEASLYQNAGYTRTVVLGHKIQVRDSPVSFKSRTNLLFVGALRDDNSPNVDSLIWFVKEVLSLVQQQLPTRITLLVAGDNSAPLLEQLLVDDVQFLGRVNDLSALYDRCRVFIAPTRFAAGIPHKVHEAAAHGIPVVATQILARQLGWHNESELLVADDPQVFADQCVRLYTDNALWTNLQEQATIAVANDCSPATFRSQIRGIFTQ